LGNKVDLLLERLDKMGGEALLVATNHPIHFLVNGALSPLSPTPTTEQMVIALLREVVPKEQLPTLANVGRTELRHSCSFGKTAQLVIERTAGGIGARWDFVDPAAEARMAATTEEPTVEDPRAAKLDVDMSLPDSDGEMEIEHAEGADALARKKTGSGSARTERVQDFEFDGEHSGVDLDIPVIADATPLPEPAPSQAPPVAGGATPWNAPKPAPAAAAAAASVPWEAQKPAAPQPAAPAQPQPPAAFVPDLVPPFTPAQPPAAAQPPASALPVAAAPAMAASPATRAAAGQKLVALLRHLVSLGGSDLHISAGAPPRIRLHGRLAPLEMPPIAADESSAMAEAVLDEKQRARFLRELSIDYAFELSGVGRFRSSVVKQRRGTSLVFRSIPLTIPTMAELGLPPSVEGLTKFPNGLVLVTGPAGAGKSTTLSVILDRINETWSDHIITVEDPIEYVHPAKNCLVNQREVGTHVRNFAEALKSALREDPDVIMVGELRDLETIQLAITAAETGHLVLGTLHTVDAAKTIDRLIDVFPGGQKAQIRGMVSESLRGVVSQQLVPTADGRGRVAAFEVLVTDRSISNLIRESKTFQIGNAMKLGKSRGMVTMDDSLADLVTKGTITAEVALASTESPEALRKQLDANARKAAVPVAGGVVPGGAPVKEPSASRRTPDARR